MPRFQCRDFKVVVLSIFKDKNINPLVLVSIKDAGLFKYVWPFIGHQALKGQRQIFILKMNKLNKRNKQFQIF